MRIPALIQPNLNQWSPRSRAAGVIAGMVAIHCATTALLAGYPNNIKDNQDEFALQFWIPADTGVSTWHVSEPYINLWICNQPLTYTTSYDEPMAFAGAYRQRANQYAGCVGGLGPGWFMSRLCYVQYLSYDPYNVTYFAALGGSRSYYADGMTKEAKTGSTMTLLWGQSGFEGVEVSYPSGAIERFGFTTIRTCNYIMLSESIDPEGRVTTHTYDACTDGFGYSYTRLRTVTDPDYKVLTINYYDSDGTNQCWQVKEVLDPYNKRATFSYETNSPYRLNRIVNAGGITNTFRYDAQGLITNAITVYGTNFFKATTNAFAPFNLGGTNQVNRSLEVTEPNGDKHLFIYRDQSTKLNPSSGTDLLPYSYPAGGVPVTEPLSNTFDNAWIDARNTFSWNAQRYQRPFGELPRQRGFEPAHSPGLQNRPGQALAARIHQ